MREQQDPRRKELPGVYRHRGVRLRRPVPVQVAKVPDAEVERLVPERVPELDGQVKVERVDARLCPQHCERRWTTS